MTPIKRKPQDLVSSPPRVASVLLSHVEIDEFIEPCAGEGELVKHLEARGCRCVWQSDISTGRDAFSLQDRELPDAPIITNPPWTREILHRLIPHFAKLRTTYLLFDFEWASSLQGIPCMKYCTEIIPVGRVKWNPGKKYNNDKETVSWYKFEYLKKPPGYARLYPRKDLGI